MTTSSVMVLNVKSYHCCGAGVKGMIMACSFVCLACENELAVLLTLVVDAGRLAGITTPRVVTSKTALGER